MDPELKTLLSALMDGQIKLAEGQRRHDVLLEGLVAGQARHERLLEKLAGTLWLMRRG
jgi:hypothetical protein